MCLSDAAPSAQAVDSSLKSSGKWPVGRFKLPQSQPRSGGFEASPVRRRRVKCELEPSRVAAAWVLHRLISPLDARFFL